MWYGRFLVEWDWHQRRYTQNLSAYDNSPTGEPKWLRAIILTIWLHCHARWLERCNHQYGASTSGFRRSQLQQQIQVLYSRSDQLLAHDQHIFQIPIADWTNKTTTQMEDWLLQYTPVIKQCLSTAKLQLKNNSSDIRKFLLPTTADQPVVQPTPRRRRRPKTTRSTLRQTQIRHQCAPPPPARRKPPITYKSTNVIPNNRPNRTIHDFFSRNDNRSRHQKIAHQRPDTPTQATQPKPR
jgi:hypothetical protein